MASITFIHTADLHLDTPFKGLSNVNKELAERLKDASLKSFRRITDICIEQKVDFLLVAGDIFDSEEQSLAAQLSFANELNRLSRAGIPAYIVTGNHDPLVSWMKELEMPALVHRFESQEVQKVTFKKNGIPQVDIYGVSFINKVVEQNLAKTIARTGSPAPMSVVLMHGTIGSTAHHPYAPFTLDDVKDKGIDYWALGHVHKWQVVNASSPVVVYPGNPQGRDFGETGLRGCCRVTMDGSSMPQVDFIPVQTIRFEEVVVDINGLESFTNLTDIITAAIQAIPDNNFSCSLILRIILSGRTPLHITLNQPSEMQQVLELLNESQLHRETFCWIDKIIVNTMPDVDLEELKRGNDFTAEILKVFDTLSADTNLLDEVFSSIENEFAPGAKKELDALLSEEKSELLTRAQWLLIDQLIKE